MARCGCASNVCTCTIQSGAGTSVTGTGTVTDPYVVTAAPTQLKVLDTASVDLTLTGNGTTDAPYTISATIATAPGPGANMPVGAIIEYAGDTAPVGWKICDGSLVARVEFSGLFAVIGTKYGVGDGTTTYNLPDLLGRVPLGAGTGAGLTGRTLAAKGGSQDTLLPSHGHGTHTHTGSSGNDSPDHAHASTIGDGAGTHQHYIDIGDRPNVGSLGSGGNVLQQYVANGRTTSAAGAHNHTISNPGATARHAHAVTVNAGTVPNAGISPTDGNMPPYLAINFIIKT